MKILNLNFKFGMFLLLVFSTIIFFGNNVFGQQVSKSNEILQTSFQNENPLYLVNIGSGDLAVRYKKGKGTPLVFVHGSWDDHHSWMPVAVQLTRELNNPIIIYDRRGHGASSPDTQQGTISQDVNDVLLLITKLGFEKAHFIGHSYGANIVVQLASLYPEKAESIVLYEPPIFGLLKDKPEYKTEMQAVKKAMTTAKTLLENGSVEEGTIHFVEKVAFGENSWQDIFDERARSTMTADFRTWLDQSNDPERLNIQPENLNNFKGNITVISGTASIPVYPAVVEELKRKVSKIRTKTIPDAAHGGLVSHPTETSNVILEHIKKSEK
ncbi:alpha/beta fold hydrolase [Vaginella massiliensis]|uniref:alpha/beta fold hydrolase n=1 Tax=Vaginella massiliensis TaxID=1816680 RepID=UPI000839989C|nr:alpha/beta hydrolase [Vaginella massiliensis]